MAQMRIILTDDDNVEINTRDYHLGLGLKKRSEMESDIENLRPQILADLTKDLLTSA